MQKFYTNINAALKLSIVENGDMVDWTFPQDFYDADGSEQFFNTYLKNNLQYLKTVPRVTTSWPTYGIEVDLNDGSAFDAKRNLCCQRQAGPNSCSYW